MKTLVATTALITEIRRIMLAQKKRGTSGASMRVSWVTLEEDEGLRECIKRELREELGIGVETGNICQAVFKKYEHFNILYWTSSRYGRESPRQEDVWGV